jgi:hypothetical protein
MGHGTVVPVVVAVDPDADAVLVEASGARLRAHTCRDGDLIAATVLGVERGTT